MTFRVEKTKNYTVMSNTHLRDNMSVQAKGLLSIMLSLPEDWDYSIKGLCAISGESEYSVKMMLKELKDKGYLVVRRLSPDETSNGRIGWEYNVYEQPQKQEGEKQSVEKQSIENRPINKVLNILNTNIPSTEGVSAPENDTLSLLEKEAKTQAEKNLLTKWKGYNLPKDVYKAVYNKMLENIGEINFNYFEKVIADYATGKKKLPAAPLKNESFDVDEFIEAAMKRGIT
jgi:hypothetical protein